MANCSSPRPPFFHPLRQTDISPELERYCAAAAGLCGHTEATVHAAECARGHGREEPHHGDGGAEAGRYASHTDHQELHHTQG